MARKLRANRVRPRLTQAAILPNDSDGDDMIEPSRKSKSPKKDAPASSSASEDGETYVGVLGRLRSG